MPTEIASCFSTLNTVRTLWNVCLSPFNVRASSLADSTDTIWKQGRPTRRAYNPALGAMGC